MAFADTSGVALAEERPATWGESRHAFEVIPGAG